MHDGNFRNGIISFDGLDENVATKAFSSLENVAWRPAQVAKKFDTLRIKELVDKEQRNALAIHSETVNELTNELIRITHPNVLFLIEKYWDLKLTSWSDPQFTLYKTGHFIKAHRDSGDAFPNRLFSVVTYLTSGYEGGELYFPTFDRSFSPTTGQTLIFPADYAHAVKPLIEGKKCIFLYFIDNH